MFRPTAPPPLQVTTLQGIWDIFDTVWGDEGPSSSTPAILVDNRRALVELLAIEDGSVNGDAPMGDTSDSSSVATTQPEQTPDDSYPDPGVPDTLLENGDDGSDHEVAIEIADSQPVNDADFTPEEPDSQGPLEEPLDELMPLPEVPDSQPAIHGDVGPWGFNDEDMAGDVSSDTSPPDVLDSKPVVGDGPHTGMSHTDVPPNTSKDPLVEHV